MRMVIPLREFSCPFTTDLDGGPQVKDRGKFKGLLQGPIWVVYLDQFVVLYRPTLSRGLQVTTCGQRETLVTREGGSTFAREPGGRRPGQQASRTRRGSPGRRARGGRGAAHARPRSHFRAGRGGAGRPAGPLISAAAAAGGARASPLTSLSRGEEDPGGRPCPREEAGKLVPG